MPLPDQRYGEEGHSWRHEWCFFTLRKIHWKFHVDILIRNVSGRGGQEGGGTWRTLRVPDWRHGGQGHPWHHEWWSFTQWKIPWKFPVDISIIIVSERGGQEGGYLEDVEGSWLEICMTGSFLTLWMIFFTLRKIPWTFRVDIRIGSVSGRGGSRRGVLGGHWGFLNRPMEDIVIPDAMNDFFSPQGRYPENFVLIPQL